MAHKKGQGSSKNGRDSNPQYRGVKVYGGAFVPAGADSAAGIEMAAAEISPSNAIAAILMFIDFKR